MGDREALLLLSLFWRYSGAQERGAHESAVACPEAADKNLRKKEQDVYHFP